MTTLLLFAVATFLLTVSPGPGVLYVTARALAQGRRAGFVSMFAIESGELVWLVAAATGLAALLAASAEALTILRFGGAAYLVYLGIQRWRHAEEIAAPGRERLGRVFVQGFVTQIVNPKVAVFFVAFLPAFLNPSAPIAPQVAALGVVYIATALVVDFSYVMAASAIGRRFLRSALARKRAGRAAAVTYVALGLTAAATGVERS
ncbi:MAG TPA: LysE family translocator [Candidatus Dormibacteraeota bacterium]|nr:LysE family translocator [Candidatus Dormibacteraeota bacterium]